TSDASGPGAGDLVFHPSTGGDTTITYSNLSPISISSSANNVTINLPAGVSDGVLQNTGVPGVEKVSSASSEFESMTFVDPSGTIQVNAPDGLTLGSVTTRGANLDIRSGNALTVTANTTVNTG